MGVKRTLLKRRKGLSRMSRLRIVESKVYRQKRGLFLWEHPICEFGECFSKSEDTHHVNGRGGRNYLDASTWKALCRRHHDWIHSHARQARELGLLRPVNGN
jgi:hypothetical protein